MDRINRAIDDVFDERIGRADATTVWAAFGPRIESMIASRVCLALSKPPTGILGLSAKAICNGLAERGISMDPKGFFFYVRNHYNRVCVSVGAGRRREYFIVDL